MDDVARDMTYTCMRVSRMLVVVDCLVALCLPVSVFYKSSDCYIKCGSQSVQIPRIQTSYCLS